MTASTTRAELPALLDRIGRACKAAVATHIAEAHPDLRFQRQILFALAALESAAGRPELENADVRLVRDAASDAAAVSRTERPDEAIQEVVACLDEAVAACDGILDEAAPAPTRPWRRFRFPDADLSVSRERRRWRVRGDAGEAANRFLDIALGEAAPLTSHRIGELTVQILDWYAYEDTHGDPR